MKYSCNFSRLISAKLSLNMRKICQCWKKQAFYRENMCTVNGIKNQTQIFKRISKTLINLEQGVNRVGKHVQLVFTVSK